MSLPQPRTRGPLAFLLASAILSAASAAPAATRTVDPSFGSGLVRIGFGGGEDPSAVAVGRTGKIVVAGDGADLAVARLLPSGGLDQAFGREGRAELDVGGRVFPSAIALSPRGDIFVAAARVRPRSGWLVDVVVIGIDRTGRLDDRFGDRGVVILHSVRTPPADPVPSLVRRSDGKLVVGFTTPGRVETASFVRLETDGSRDPSFGIDGAISFPGGVDAMTMARDRSIVYAGGRRVLEVRRLLPDGAPDPTFAQPTDVSRTWPVPATSIRIQPDGRILVAGGREVLRVVRLSSAGVPDLSFSGDGVAVVSTGSGREGDRIGRLALGADGSIFATAARGSCDVFYVCNQTPVLVRLTGDGERYPGFGREGTLVLRKLEVEIVEPPQAPLGACPIVRSGRGPLVTCSIPGPSGNDFGVFRLLT